MSRAAYGAEAWFRRFLGGAMYRRIAWSIGLALIAIAVGAGPSAAATVEGQMGQIGCPTATGDWDSFTVSYVKKTIDDSARVNWLIDPVGDPPEGDLRENLATAFSRVDLNFTRFTLDNSACATPNWFKVWLRSISGEERTIVYQLFPGEKVVLTGADTGPWSAHGSLSFTFSGGSGVWGT